MSNETSTKSGAIVAILAPENASSYEKTAIATDPETDFENVTSNDTGIVPHWNSGHVQQDLEPSGFDGHGGPFQ
ncbi:hypothetical protein HK405_006619, partial [Cladochytrium tenue]